MELKLHLRTSKVFPSKAAHLANVSRLIGFRSTIIIGHWEITVCDSGPESESAISYRLQLPLRLRPKQSTQTDFNSGFDSDSAALVMSKAYLHVRKYNYTYFYAHLFTSARASPKRRLVVQICV